MQTSKPRPPRNFLGKSISEWKQVDWVTMREEATAFSKTFPSASADRSVAENYDQIDKLITSVLRHVLTKMSRARIDLPWLSQALKRKCKAKQRLYNRAKKSGKPGHHKHYKEAQKSFQSELKKAKRQYINSTLYTSLDKGNHKPFWKFIRIQREDNVGVAPLKEDGRLQAPHEAKYKILAKQFKSVFTDDKYDPFSEARLHGPSYPPIRDLYIREEGVQKLLAGIDPCKASGPDEIPFRVLRELASELAPVFTCLFRQSLLTGDLPQSWLTAWIAPVFQKGPRCEPGNYRPVSLACVMCKLMEHFICTHIRSHSDRHGILSDLNHGFRSRHSCESQLLITTHDFLARMDRREETDVLVLDFSKTVDTVPHKRLLQKL